MDPVKLLQAELKSRVKILEPWSKGAQMTAKFFVTGTDGYEIWAKKRQSVCSIEH